MIAGKIYDGKFYVLKTNSLDLNEAYDFQSKTWNSWPAAPKYVSSVSCIVNWKNNFIVFDHERVQIYNIPTQVMKIHFFFPILTFCKKASVCLTH